MERSRSGHTYHRNGANLTVWRRKVAAVLMGTLKPSERKQLPLTEAVKVTVEFVVPKPKSNRDLYPTSQRVGDLDKFLRAVGDGLEQGGILQNDALICEFHTRKRYANPDEETGANVKVEAYDPTAP